jgi:uncharacterized membrane protein YgcG
MCPYVIIIALMVIFRVHEIDEIGHCKIGLLRPAALPLILYDMFLSIWLTGLFIRPLVSSHSMLQGPTKGRLRDVARRTLVGALVALLLSSANIFTLVYFEGNERGLVCLSCCTADVTLNAITIHWVTSSGASKLEKTGYVHRGYRAGGNNDAKAGRGYGGNGYVSHNPMNMLEKQMGPVEPHITVEAYVDEFHSSTFLNNSSSTSSGSRSGGGGGSSGSGGSGSSEVDDSTIGIIV